MIENREMEEVEAMIPTAPTPAPSMEALAIVRVKPRHREIARMMAIGMTQGQIAKYFNMTPGRLSIIANSPLFKLELARLEKARNETVADIRNQLLEAAPAAAEVLEHIMYTSESEKTKMAAAEAILDRAGIERKGSAIGVQVNLNIDPVDLSKYRSDPEQALGIGEHIEGEVIQHEG